MAMIRVVIRRVIVSEVLVMEGMARRMVVIGRTTLAQTTRVPM